MPELEDILLNSYKSTIKVFSKRLRDNKYMSIMLETKQDAMQDAIDAEMQLFLMETVTTRSSEIIETTKNETNAFLAAILLLAAQNDETLENDVVAKKISRKMSARAIPRSNTIAMTEILNVAERSKLTEAFVISTTPVAGTTPDIIKRWDATLDSKTRPAHVMADDQKKSLNDPFDVDGEFLRHPGDTSLGASAGNVINCRCVTNYLSKDEA